jgi:LEA14-like dessication related protein
MKKFFLFLLLSTLLLQGCSSYRQISVDDVEIGKVKITALTRAQVQTTLKINNPTRSTFRITALEGTVKNKDVEFARISLPQEFSVPPGTPATVETMLAVEVSDPLSLLSSGLSLKSLKAENFTIDAAVQIKKGGVSKWLRMKDVPLKQLLENIKL